MTHLFMKDKVKSIIEASNWFPRQETQESFCIVEFHEWLKEEPTEMILYVIAVIHSELPGYASHPTVITILEMLEGIMALREVDPWH